MKKNKLNFVILFYCNLCAKHVYLKQTDSILKEGSRKTPLSHILTDLHLSFSLQSPSFCLSQPQNRYLSLSATHHPSTCPLPSFSLSHHQTLSIILFQSLLKGCLLFSSFAFYTWPSLLGIVSSSNPMKTLWTISLLRPPSAPSPLALLNSSMVYMFKQLDVAAVWQFLSNSSVLILFCCLFI